MVIIAYEHLFVQEPEPSLRRRLLQASSRRKPPGPSWAARGVLFRRKAEITCKSLGDAAAGPRGKTKFFPDLFPASRRGQRDAGPMPSLLPRKQPAKFCFPARQRSMTAQALGLSGHRTWLRRAIGPRRSHKDPVSHGSPRPPSAVPAAATAPSFLHSAGPLSSPA